MIMSTERFMFLKKSAHGLPSTAPAVWAWSALPGNKEYLWTAAFELLTTPDQKIQVKCWGRLFNPKQRISNFDVNPPPRCSHFL